MKSLLPILFLLSACASKSISSRKPSGAFQKATSTGAIFIRDVSNPKLGESWRDPDDLVWGDIFYGKEGAPTVSWFYAYGYCSERNARLPTVDEFKHLTELLGKNADGHLNTVSTEGEFVIPHFSEGPFWTGDVPSFYARQFNPANGTVTRDARTNFAYARCVTNRTGI